MKPIEIHYESLTENWFDEAMYTGARAKSWLPRHALDISRPWPEKYLNTLNQPFNPFTFAVNCSTLLGASKHNGTSKPIIDQAKYLDFIATLYIQKIGELDYVFNDFNHPIFWANMPKPFYGAFMNCVTAYGYMKLFEIEGQESYLQKAHNLLLSATSQDAEIRLSGHDGQGDFWLNEYVFKPIAKETNYLQSIGTELGGDGYMRFRIFNGHIHALIALLKYRHLSGRHDFSTTIDAAMATMAKTLIHQIYEDRYFSYAIEAKALPDYGQSRAVRLAKALAECCDNENLNEAAHKFINLYSERIKHAEDAIYKEGLSNARTQYLVTQQHQASPNIT